MPERGVVDVLHVEDDRYALMVRKSLALAGSSRREPSIRSGLAARPVDRRRARPPLTPSGARRYFLGRVRESLRIIDRR